MIRLHDYWRSGAGYRVRIALSLKRAGHERVAHDLRTGEQADPAYARLNPQRLVPALETGEGVITQSRAILEWIEESWPEPPLLPAGRQARAIVRSMADIVACDIHPLHNLRVLNALSPHLDADGVRGWIGHWMTEGFAALETLVARHGGVFAHGDHLSIADCCLVPQLYAAERFGVPVDAFPRLCAAVAAARAVPAVAAAHPDMQADAPGP